MDNTFLKDSVLEPSNTVKIMVGHKCTDEVYKSSIWLLPGTIWKGCYCFEMPTFRQFKYGIEIRIWSVNQDSSHSWVRISYGTVKYVIDSIEDNTEIPADHQEEQIPQTSTSVVAAKPKEKSKPQPRALAGTTATIPMHERRLIDIETSKQNLASHDISDQSSSKQSSVTAVRRWSNWILLNPNLSSRSSFTNTLLVWWSMDNSPGCRRKLEKNISVLLWQFGNNSLPPFSSRTFWKQSHWFCVTGQCVDWNWKFPHI